MIRGDAAFTHSQPVTLTMPDQAGAIIEGTDGPLYTIGGDGLGMSLAMADVDQDSHADLIMGAPWASGPANLIGLAGEVYVWLGRTLQGQRFDVSDEAAWILYGAKSQDRLGTAIAAGDFDSDGYPEILLRCLLCEREGPPTYLAGRGYVVEPLQLTGLITVSAASLLDIVPYSGAWCLGTAVATMDLDGDGRDDLVVGAPCNYYGLEDDLPGTVYVVAYPIQSRLFFPWLQQ